MNGYAAKPKSERPKSKASDERWEPILPPPQDAPAPDPCFIGYGLIFPYPDSEGRILFYVRRREARGDRKKQFHPLTHGRLNGELGWHSRHSHAPMPLYGLDSLAARPEALVLICEGEKAADAAARLFPERVCITWPGGTPSPHKADWTAIRGRSADYWPDNDAPGRKAAREVVGSLAPLV
jgi:putative DNA primase/helicase